MRITAALSTKAETIHLDSEPAGSGSLWTSELVFINCLCGPKQVRRSRQIHSRQSARTTSVGLGHFRFLVLNFCGSGENLDAAGHSGDAKEEVGTFSTATGRHSEAADYAENADSCSCASPEMKWNNRVAMIWNCSRIWALDQKVLHRRDWGRHGWD
jgi:hypothetical protein